MNESQVSCGDFSCQRLFAKISVPGDGEGLSLIRPFNKEEVCDTSRRFVASSGYCAAEGLNLTLHPQVAVVMKEQAKVPAPSQQPPQHTNGGSIKHEVGGSGGRGGPQPQVNTRLKDGSYPG